MFEIPKKILGKSVSFFGRNFTLRIWRRPILCVCCTLVPIGVPWGSDGNRLIGPFDRTQQVEPTSGQMNANDKKNQRLYAVFRKKMQTDTGRDNDTRDREGKYYANWPMPLNRKEDCGNMCNSDCGPLTPLTHLGNQIRLGEGTFCEGMHNNGCLCKQKNVEKTLLSGFIEQASCLDDPHKKTYQSHSHFISSQNSKKTNLTLTRITFFDACVLVHLLLI